MAITTDERRFLRNWEEQREGGKSQYVAIYSFGFTILIFLCCVALGLFMSLPFIKPVWLIIMGVASLIGGIIASIAVWGSQEKKFRQIIRREIKNSGGISA